MYFIVTLNVMSVFPWSKNTYQMKRLSSKLYRESEVLTLELRILRYIVYASYEIIVQMGYQNTIDTRLKMLEIVYCICDIILCKKTWMK